MANEITIVVKSRNEAKPGMDAAVADVAKLEAEAKALGEEFGRTTSRSGDLGAGLKGAGTRADEVSALFDRLEQHTVRLRDQFDQTSKSNPLSGMLRGAEGDLKRVEGDVVRTFENAGQQGGQEMAKGISAAFQGIASTPGVGPALVGGIAAAIVAGAALIGAALNGVLLSAAGLGGIGLGIVGQIKSPAVRDAFTGLGHGLENTLQQATASFEQPLVQAAHIFGGALQQAIKSIDFGALSKLLTPLASGLGGLFTNMMPGFNDALRAAQPIIEELAKDLPILGSAVSDMFHDFAQGGHGAEEGLRSLLMIVVGLVEMIGLFVEGMSIAYEWIVKLADGFAEFGKKVAHALHDPVLEKFFDIMARTLGIVEQGTGTADTFGRSLGGVAGSADTAAGKVGFLSDQIGTMVTASQEAAAEAKALFDSFMSVDQGTLHWHESLTSLHDALAKGKATLDENTKAGQQHVAAILSAVQANMSLYQAQVAAGMSADDAAKQYDANEQALERQLRAAGYTQQQIDGLVGKYRGIPDSVSPAQRAMQNLTDTMNRLVDTLRTIFNLPNHKDFSINVALTGVGIGTLGSLANQVAGLVGHHASGGVWGGLTTLAEQGSELVKLPQGSMVLSGADTQRQLASMQQPAQQSAGPTTIAFAGDTDSAFATAVMRMFREGKMFVPASAVN